jgi:beta-glucosidase
VTTFPDGFAWGTATAAYQIEGAVSEDGRLPSIWDTFSHRPGTILHGDTGDVACDHYHRYPQDAQITGWLGTQFYRFSLAWPRLQPTGQGKLHRPGADFYHRLLDELDKAGVQPWVTIYHWDLPQALEDAGGWPARDTALRFADFAAAVHEEFADRIGWWTTLNEPFCTAFYGYAEGRHAPGRTEPGAALAAGHHLMLGHGLAVERMRAARPDSKLGITLNLTPYRPASEEPADQRAAQRLDARKNRFFLDPIFTGRYPAGLLSEFTGLGFEDQVRDGDLGHIAAPLDVLGINYYSRACVRARTQEEIGAAAGRPSPWVNCDDVASVDRGLPRTQMGWEIDPGGLADLLTWASREYALPPLYVTENGMASDDHVAPDGTVPDEARIAYLDAHLRACHRAIADGVDLRGYFVWSLLDNFEWALGLERRFGLVHVDYGTQQRTPKASAHWYRQVIAANGLADQ